MTHRDMLKVILKESHWTQEQLAAKLGVSFATVNSWINGRTKPQKSLMPDIERLYLAQDVTNEPEPVYITLVNVVDGARVGDYVILEKDKDNDYDDEAIEAYRVDADGNRLDEDSEIIILGDAEEGSGAEVDPEEVKRDVVEAVKKTISEADWGKELEMMEVRMSATDDEDGAEDELSVEGYPRRSMHVANSVRTVVRGTRSAGRIYDKFDGKARAQVVFVAKTRAIARVVSWNA